MHANSLRGLFLSRGPQRSDLPPALAVGAGGGRLPAGRAGSVRAGPLRRTQRAGLDAGRVIRRPFSIAGLRRDGRRCELDILHRAVGTGTRWLSRLRPGEPVSLLGPLGRPFAIPADRKLAWLVGGGIGLPPLIWLASELHALGRPAVAFCGARSADSMPLTRVPGVAVSGREAGLSFKEFATAATPVIACTDDGSMARPASSPKPSPAISRII